MTITCSGIRFYVGAETHGRMIESMTYCIYGLVFLTNVLIVFTGFRTISSDTGLVVRTVIVGNAAYVCLV